LFLLAEKRYAVYPDLLLSLIRVDNATALPSAPEPLRLHSVITPPTSDGSLETPIFLVSL